MRRGPASVCLSSPLCHIIPLWMEDQSINELFVYISSFVWVSFVAFFDLACDYVCLSLFFVRPSFFFQKSLIWRCFWHLMLATCILLSSSIIFPWYFRWFLFQFNSITSCSHQFQMHMMANSRSDAKFWIHFLSCHYTQYNIMKRIFIPNCFVIFVCENHSCTLTLHKSKPWHLSCHANRWPLCLFTTWNACHHLWAPCVCVRLIPTRSG